MAVGPSAGFLLVGAVARLHSWIQSLGRWADIWLQPLVAWEWQDVTIAAARFAEALPMLRRSVEAPGWCHLGDRSAWQWQVADAYFPANAGGGGTHCACLKICHSQVLSSWSAMPHWAPACGTQVAATCV